MNKKMTLLAMSFMLLIHVNAQAGRDCPHNQRGCNDEMIYPSQRQTDLPCRNPWSGCPDEPPPPPVKENPLDQCKDRTPNEQLSSSCEIVSFGEVSLPQTDPILIFKNENLLGHYNIRIKAVDERGNILSPGNIAFSLDGHRIKASYLELDTHKDGEHRLLVASSQTGRVFYSLARIKYNW